MKTLKKIITNLFSINLNDDLFFKDTPVEVSEADGIRSMHIGSVTIQSSMNINSPYSLELDYTQAMALVTLFLNNPSEILFIGLGGGTMQKFFHRAFTKSKLTVLEVNPQVINIAKHFFRLPKESSRFKIIEGDGINYIASTDCKYDLFLSDAFEEYGLPETFCTLTYFESCKKILSDDGIFVINLWGSDPKTPIYINRIMDVFNQQVFYVQSDKPGNIIVFGFNYLLPSLKESAVKKKLKLLERKFNLKLMLYFNRLIKNSSIHPSDNALFNKE
mgnify:CR=1 FL=1